MYLCVHIGYKGGTQGGVRKGCALVLVPAPLAYLITKEARGVLSYLYLQGYLVQVQVLEVLRTIRVLGVLVHPNAGDSYKRYKKGMRLTGYFMSKKMYNGFKRYNKVVEPPNLPLLYLLYMREIRTV